MIISDGKSICEWVKSNELVLFYCGHMKTIVNKMLQKVFSCGAQKSSNMQGEGEWKMAKLLCFNDAFLVFIYFGFVFFSCLFYLFPFEDLPQLHWRYNLLSWSTARKYIWT